MNRLSATLLGLVSLTALLTACSGGSSEAVTPESSAKPATSATATATASAAVTPPPPATATASAVAATPPPPEPAADLKIVPMKMSLGKGATVELKADGTLWGTKGAKSEQVGNFSKNSLNITSGKNGSISVWKDNSVTITDATKKAHFDDKDALVIDDGGKLTIDDKGKLSAIKADGTTDKTAPAMTLTGFKPEARRAGVLMAVLFLMATDEPKASAPVAVPATTPATTPATPPPAGKH